MPKLDTFMVRGYRNREPISRVVKITDVNEESARATYARSHGLKRDDWDANDPKAPFKVAIRVSEAGQPHP